MEQPTRSFTDFWARKMRKVFRAIDVQKRGFLTEATLEELFDQWHKDYPSLERARLKKTQKHVWTVLYNNGREVPRDFKLTEDMFMDNMWVSVNQPNFREEISKMSTDIFKQMDLKHNGYITREEYVKMNGMRAGEDVALATFNAMDTDRDGKISFDDFVQSKFFYYTDITEDMHPFNQMNGPLDSN